MLNIYQGGPRAARRVLLPRRAARRRSARPTHGSSCPAMLDPGRRGRTPTGRRERHLELETELAAGHWDRVRSRDSYADLQPDDRARSSTSCCRPSCGTPGWPALGAPSRSCSSRSSSGSRIIWPPWPACSPPIGCRRGRTGWPGRSSGRPRPFGPATLVEQNFDFYGRTLSGHAAAAGAVEARRVVRRDWRPARRSAGCTSSGTFRRRPSSGWTSWSRTCSRPTDGTSATCRG